VDLLFTPPLASVVLVEADEVAVVTLIQSLGRTKNVQFDELCNMKQEAHLVLVGLDPLESKLLYDYCERLLGTGESRSEGDVELVVAVLLELLCTLERLFLAVVGESGVCPAGEKVLLCEGVASETRRKARRKRVRVDPTHCSTQTRRDEQEQAERDTE
jgi:hypothetical protein